MSTMSSPLVDGNCSDFHLHSRAECGCKVYPSKSSHSTNIDSSRSSAQSCASCSRSRLSFARSCARCGDSTPAELEPTLAWARLKGCTEANRWSNCGAEGGPVARAVTGASASSSKRGASGGMRANSARRLFQRERRRERTVSADLDTHNHEPRNARAKQQHTWHPRHQLAGSDAARFAECARPIARDAPTLAGNPIPHENKTKPVSTHIRFHRLPYSDSETSKTIYRTIG